MCGANGESNKTIELLGRLRRFPHVFLDSKISW